MQRLTVDGGGVPRGHGFANRFAAGIVGDLAVMFGGLSEPISPPRIGSFVGVRRLLDGIRHRIQRPRPHVGIAIHTLQPMRLQVVQDMAASR